ncbi:MAG: prolipoprotein diacylglyceryl transferase, partial [Chloroflexota bacterium]|nr:prolipoprotein diacylglyceryl transferase [Chloroflexota bacterium]
MLPVLFHIGSYPVGTHDFFVLLGVIAATIVYFYEAQRRGMLDDRLLVIALGALFCGAVVAKLSTAWQYVAATPEPSIWGVLQQGGKSILGGLLGV